MKVIAACFHGAKGTDQEGNRRSRPAKAMLVTSRFQPVMPTGSGGTDSGIVVPSPPERKAGSPAAQAALVFSWE